MASNPVPENRNRARALAEDIADGLKTLEQSVGIKQNTQVVMRAALTLEQTAFNTKTASQSGLDGGYTALQIGDSNAKALIGNKLTDDVLAKLELVGDNRSALYQIDQQAGRRAEAAKG